MTPPPRISRHHWPHRLGRLIRRRRRLFAALLLCAAAALTVQQLTPGSTEMVSVVVATSDVATGTALSSANTTVSSRPVTAVPAQAFTSTQEVTGSRTAVPLRKGQVLTDTLLVGKSLLLGAPPGSVAVPLRLADPATASLFSPGQRVDVVLQSTDPTGRSLPNSILAHAVPVLWVQPPGQSGGGWMPSGSAEGLVVVAATADQAAPLAGANGRVVLVLVS
ncbi:RcpC/CpaB family pilus assembly protein [Psychromicrobium xiongbiense]|uniref:RcpC/CpaB family pilus assembly protein n=1 Tax=Psychromicrobium xiongbiense TaxID=3051184 RepID=UPI002554F621|nr:SAF domain-containing protein [Psychromicrobium sp. YIM S02556]